MYKPLQKKNSSWTPTSIQKNSKAKSGTFTVQTFRENKSSEQQEIPKSPRVAAAGMVANVMQAMATREQVQQTQTLAVQRQSESTQQEVAPLSIEAGGTETLCESCKSEMAQENQIPSQSITRSLEETEEGTETIDTRTLGTSSVEDSDGSGGSRGSGGSGGSGGATSCSVTGAFSSIPSGTLSATLSGTKLGAAFNMVGDFTPSIPCNCSGGEYRQYVRGTFTRNGANVVHPLCGTTLHATTFQEDCGIFGGTVYKYGYRSIPFGNSKFINPDQATGCTFQGKDHPGIGGASGDTLGINLDFKGDLIDTWNSNNVIASSAWSVVGTATVP